MVVLDNFKTVNTFSVDCNGKGKCAENDFIQYFHSNPKNQNKTLFDVRMNKEYQIIDVDFVIDNEGGEILCDINEVLMNPKRYLKIEVKYSGAALKKNKPLHRAKMAFEMISHSYFGWGMICQCDYMYMTLGYGEKQNDGSYDIIKRCIIDFKKWKEAIRSKNIETDVYFNQDEGKIVNIMTYLDEMEKKGILMYI